MKASASTIRPGLLPRALALGAAFLLVRSSGAPAQAPEAATEAAAAAATITAEDLRDHVGLLAADSMRGRDTPSPELEATARYIAEQFRSFGLSPGVGDSFQQPYPLTVIRSPDPGGQSLRLRSPEGSVTELRGGRDFIPVGGGGALVGRGLVRITESLGRTRDAAGQVLLVRVTSDAISSTLSDVRGALERTGASGVLLAVEMGEGRFGQMARFFGRERMQLGEPEPLEVPLMLVRRASLPDGLRDALTSGRAGSPDPDGWRATVRSDIPLESATAMNTIGILEGSDPELRDEYVIFTAHMDHVGVGRPVDGDSIYNGADDDGSGTATIVELAEAYARTEPRPRRSLVFMTVSGEEKGLLGSRWYSEHPVFPLDRTVANVNIDMIGRNWEDTVVAIGQDHSSLGETVSRVAEEHAELGIKVVEDRWPEQRFYYRSDHYNFARKGVPVLFFFTGIHEDYHRPSDEVDEVLYPKTARIARLIYHLGLEVANADERPSWDPESYRRIVEGEGG